MRERPVVLGTLELGALRLSKAEGRDEIEEKRGKDQEVLRNG